MGLRGAVDCVGGLGGSSYLLTTKEGGRGGGKKEEERGKEHSEGRKASKTAEHWSGLLEIF